MESATVATPSSNSTIAAPANPGARQRERTIAFIVVVLPFVGTLAAIILMWGWGVGPVDVGLLIGMYVFTMFGVGMGLHRYFAHRSFETSRPVKGALAILGSMAAQGPIFYWVAIHRRHHTHSDEPGDPHSPHLGQPAGFRGVITGFWHAHIGWMFDHDATNWPRYIHDLIRDPMLFAINRSYFLWVFLGLLIPTVLGGLLTESWWGAFTGLLWGGFVRISLVHHAAWSLGSVSHLFGYQEFDTHDHSTNYWVTALPTFGESWHNNHHAFPYAAYHGMRWWQFDINALMIRFLAMCGVVWGVKQPSAEAIAKVRLAKPQT